MAIKNEKVQTKPYHEIQNPRDREDTKSFQRGRDGEEWLKLVTYNVSYSVNRFKSNVVHEKTVEMSSEL